MKSILLKCGCRANATDSNGQPSCAIHAGLTDTSPATEQPDLTGRTAQCDYCKRTRPSSLDLPFFNYHPDKDKDQYYCGCRGWD